MDRPTNTCPKQPEGLKRPEKRTNPIKGQDLQYLIGDLHQQAESIRQTELDKTLRHLPDLSEGERSGIEALTRVLVARILCAPTSCLQTEAGSPRASEYAAVARTLFDLPDENLIPSTHPKNLRKVK